MQNKISVTCIRLFGVFGPEQSNKLIPNLIESIRNKRSIYLHPSKKNTKDIDGLRLSLCYIDDVVSIIYKICQNHDAGTINISSNEVKSIKQICDVIGSALGIEPDYNILMFLENMILLQMSVN